MRHSVKPVLILFIIGTLVSAQQVSSENLFVECDDLGLDGLELADPDFTSSLPRGMDVGINMVSAPGHAGPGFFSACFDTLETFDVELEEEKGSGFYKELAAFIIVAAMVGYMLVTIIKPDEQDEETDPGSGKDIPKAFTGITIPLNR